MQARIWIVVGAVFLTGVAAERAWAKACCLPDGSCIETTEADCLAQNGVFFESDDCEDVFCGPPGECRVTGGGVDASGNWDGTYCRGHSHNDRYQFGGQVGAPTASQPQPHGEWQHHQQRGPHGKFSFHAGTASAPPETEIAFVECSDPGFCNPARPAPAKQIDFEGVGQFSNIDSDHPDLAGVVANVTLHWFEVHIEDLGEPGRNGRQSPPGAVCPDGGSAGGVANCDCPDFYRLKIHADTDPASTVIYEVWGYINGGNLQIHPPVGG